MVSLVIILAQVRKKLYFHVQLILCIGVLVGLFCERMELQCVELAAFDWAFRIGMVSCLECIKYFLPCHFLFFSEF